MLSRNTIEKVEDIVLSEVIGKYVQLKKAGSTWEGLSPFVEEKTASFKVSDSKGFWKCFSSGKGGASGISFVMACKDLSYPQAITEIADSFGIIPEYDESERSKENMRKSEQKKSIYDVNLLAVEYFQSNIDKIPTDKLRTSEKSYEKFNLGFAPDDWQGLANFLKGKGISYDLMKRAALVSEAPNKKGHYYDFFRGRIMFPIYSRNGKVLGFSGRNIVPMETPEDEKKYKVFNSKDTEAYHKSESLLGLFQAIKGIEQMKYAVIVEGNFDVTAMHDGGLINTVGNLGTALTQEQAELLRKYTDSICIFADNDKAGIAALIKNSTVLLEMGFKVSCFIPKVQGMDPDDLFKSKDWQDEEFKEMFEAEKRDAVEYLAEQLYKDADSIIKKSIAQTKLSDLLSLISNNVLRNEYVKHFAKLYKIERKAVEDGIKLSVAERKVPEEDNNGRKLPAFLKEDDIIDFQEFGFYEDKHPDKIGYYFANGAFGFEKVTNFLIHPIIQVKAQRDSNRIIQIENKIKKSIIILPNKSLVSAQQFEEIVMNEGNFDFQGTAKQFKKIRQKIIAKFPFCIEIRTLGWQDAGFYAFANGIIDDGFKKSDSNGLCYFNEEKYFLPAFSDVYKNAQKEDDVYEADRHFVYRPSKINFSEWSSKMVRVHLDNGIWASLFVMATIFRDHIFSTLSFFPHLFGFGQVATGKSTCARSINSIFFGNQVAFMLSSGTQIAFIRRLARCMNAVVWFDEYSNDIDEKRFQALKGAFDGTGHERGVMSRDNRTETTSINSSSMITGQYLPTRDGNSLYSRSVLLTFERKQQDLTLADIEEYKELEQLEKKGLSNLIQEIVKYRNLVEDEFSSVNYEIVAQMKVDLEGEAYVGRVMGNFAIMCTMHKLIGEKLNLPFTFEKVYKQALQKIVKQSEQITDSDQLSEFWKIVEYMSFQYEIKNNQDYMLVNEDSIKVRIDRNNSETKIFPRTIPVLYVRLSMIHGAYMQAHRKQFGVNGVPEQSILSYMKTSKEFIGSVASVNFDGTKTSAYAFNYEMLNIQLKSNHKTESEEEPKTQTISSDKSEAGKQDDLPF